jgi:putative DNA primase/helicase
MLTAEVIAQTLAGERRPERVGTGWLTWCPCHEDHDPSLSISAGNDGKILVKCHAGCSNPIVIGELKARNLWPSRDGNVADLPKGRARIIKTYDYRDAQGNLAFQVCRMIPKSFRQRRPDGQGGWVWGLTADDYYRHPGKKDWFRVNRTPPSGAEVKHFPECPPILYRLDELLRADPATPVFICEGEADADALAALGLVATTCPMGAGKWRKKFNQYFQGKRVIILADNDDPGRAHAQDVARNLHGVAASIKVVELPDLPDKGDVSDWLAAGGTVEQLQILVDATAEWKPRSQDAAPAPTIDRGLRLTDWGNAERLVDLHGQDLRYCHPWKKWLVWDGRRWATDDTAEVERRAKDVVRTIYREAAVTQDQKLREALGHHALKSESEAKRKAMVVSAWSEPTMPILSEHLDRNPWLLNVLNGTIDLRTGKLRPHSRSDFITKLAPVHFDPKAECPLWWKFLERILPPEVIEFVQKAAGYSATGLTMEQVFFLLYGLGDNGKTVLLETIGGILGDYTKQTDPETFMLKKYSSIPNDVAALRGARFVKSVETSGGRRMSEARIKQMTGEDTVPARFLHAEWFSFKPQFKLWLGTNHKPIIRDPTHAMWKRVRFIPFEVQIPKAEQDKQLSKKLKEEWPGILNWIIGGGLSWQHEGLEPPEAIRQATQTYREETDVLGDFLTECCVLAPGASVGASELYRAYTKWAEENGEKNPLSQTAFGLSLTERGFKRKPSTGGKIVRLGIGLKT